MKNRCYRRSKKEVYVSVLEAINHEHYPLKIMDESNTSWRFLIGEIFPYLIKNGLIFETKIDDEKEKKHKYSYTITSKGIKIIQLVGELRKLFGEIS